MPGDCRRLARIDKRVIPPGGPDPGGLRDVTVASRQLSTNAPYLLGSTHQAFAQGARSVPNPNPPLTGREGELSPLDNARGLRDSLSPSQSDRMSSGLNR